MSGIIDTIKKSSESINGAGLKSKFCNTTPISNTSIIGNVAKKTSNIISSTEDKRVSLTAVPRTNMYNDTLFADKIAYVLGKKSTNPKWVLSGSEFHGLLRSSLGSSAGLIFPYTPKIGFQGSVKYENTQIMHSNIDFNSYKNTSSPTISITANFSADNRQNALHMLSAIWFITACSKCDFGENSINGENVYAGLPPPILYLSGYNSTIDNIPVVITSYNYDYPDTAHYVNLILDLSQSGEDFLPIYKFERTLTYKNEDGHIPTLYKTTNSGGIPLSFWLPMTLSMNIQLKIQQNLLKTRKQWSLEGYKSGYLMTKLGKNESKEGKIYITDTIEGRENVCSPETEKLSFLPSGWTW